MKKNSIDFGTIEYILFLADECRNKDKVRAEELEKVANECTLVLSQYMQEKITPMIQSLAGSEGEKLRNDLKRFERDIDRDLIKYLRLLSIGAQDDDVEFSNFVKRLADECAFLLAEKLSERFDNLKEKLVCEDIISQEGGINRENADKAINRALDNVPPSRELVEYMLDISSIGDFESSMLMLRVAEEASTRLDDKILLARCKQREIMQSAIAIRNYKNKEKKEGLIKIDLDKIISEAKEDYEIAKKFYTDFGLSYDLIELDVCMAELLDACGEDGLTLLEKCKNAYLERGMSEWAQKIEEIIKKIKK